MSEQITKEELLEMKLHEIKKVPCEFCDVNVRRVFGGWIYTSVAWDSDRDIMTSSSMCFVPKVINVEGQITNHY